MPRGRSVIGLEFAEAATSQILSGPADPKV
jgi:hypothetical protein